jgi:hypothetical protein
MRNRERIAQVLNSKLPILLSRLQQINGRVLGTRERLQSS